MQIWLKKKKNIFASYSKKSKSLKEIPILEDISLAFKLTSFSNDVLGKLI